MNETNLTFEKADKLLQGRCAFQRKLAKAAWLVRVGENIAIRLYNTDVVVLRPDGKVVLNTNGYSTVTTKERMNRVKGLTVWAKDFVWHVSDRNGDHEFQDGIVVHPFTKYTWEFQSEIEETLERGGPYAHNIIGLTLKQCAKERGDAATVKIMRKLRLDQKGWKIPQ